MTVASNGNWTLTGVDVHTLADGNLTFTATATDAAGNSASSTKTSVKNTAAPQLTVNTPNAVNLANQHSTSISGTGVVGATISVQATDGTATTNPQTATVAADGSWTVTAIDVSTLADGTITYNVTETSAGNSATGSKTASKQVLTFASVTDPIGGSNQHSVVANGTGQVGATVSVVASDGTHSSTAQTAVVAGDGTWTVTAIDVGDLSDGPITVTATIDDGASHTQSQNLTTTKDTQAPGVVITAVTDPIGSAQAANTLVNGTGEADATISVRGQRRCAHDRSENNDRPYRRRLVRPGHRRHGVG